MDLGIKGRVAVVCAASKGMGRASALQLAREGAHLTIFSRDADRINHVAEEIRTATGAVVLAMAADVTKTDDMKSVVAATVKKFGTIHILVNNSGGPPPGVMDDFTPAEWENAVRSHLISPINWCREVIPIMKKQTWGRIVNITSISVKQPVDGLILSNTARAGFVGFVKTIARELAPDNVLVNNVCPGTVLTDRIRELAMKQARMADITIAEVFDHMESNIPMKRMGKPEEVANLVAFLASEAAAYMTGTTILVDGGIYRGIM